MKPLKAAQDSAVFGGKAGHLAALIKAGLPVPEGIAISLDAFNDDGTLAQKFELSVKKFLESSKKYAVRSSALVEDSEAASWAGQFESYLQVPASQVLKQVIACHNSAAERTKSYGKHAGNTTGKYGVAVVIQEMVQAEFAGVLFTKNPVSGADETIIEYVKGLGEALVQGIAEPTRLVIDNTQKIGKMEAPFSVSALVKLAQKAVQYFGQPQDIEWAWAYNKFWFVQARPITTLAKKPEGDKKLSKLLETQISLTEWLQNINHTEANAIREEDNYKRERIGVMNGIIGIPYDKPETFEAVAVAKRSKAFTDYLKVHGDELCALRVIPHKGKDLAKHRMRGKPVHEAVEWFDSLDINPVDYVADIVPHPPDYAWATIFIVNDHGIFGEIYYGGHHILTQGFHTEQAPMTFAWDFKTWRVEPKNADALNYLKRLVKYIHVPELVVQQALQDAVQAEFSHNYIKGYFESAESKAFGTWFIDYNRLLGKRYESFVLNRSGSTVGTLVSGQTASSGFGTGSVQIVNDPSDMRFKENDILVCAMTSPDYVRLMQKAAAIVTDQGGILCHAAIVARELGKPCIVGTGNATSVLKNGQAVKVDASHGIVTAL